MGKAADRRRDHRQSVDERFEDHRGSHIDTRRVREHVGGGKGGKKLVAGEIAEPADAVGDAEACSLPLDLQQPLVVGRDTGDHQHRVGCGSQRLERAVEPFDLRLEPEPKPRLRRFVHGEAAACGFAQLGRAQLRAPSAFPDRWRKDHGAGAALRVEFAKGLHLWRRQAHDPGFRAGRETGRLEAGKGAVTRQQAFQKRQIGPAAQMIGEEEDVEARHRLKSDHPVEPASRSDCLKFPGEGGHAAVIGGSAFAERHYRQVELRRLSGCVKHNRVTAPGEFLRNADRMVFQPAARRQAIDAERDFHARMAEVGFIGGAIQTACKLARQKPCGGSFLRPFRSFAVEQSSIPGLIVKLHKLPTARMYVLAFATDYDGTFADHGIVTDAAYAALERLKQTGRKLLLVTGRDLDDLIQVFSGLDIFDKVVAENGALLYTPATREKRVLAPPPSKALVKRLTREGVTPLHVGRSVVATEEPYEVNALHAIRELGLELEIIFNKGAVMILPTGINKASGLAAALEELEFSMHNVVGIGDAQNDHAFLRAAGFGVAVDNALPELKETADLVTKSARGAGVIELADKIIKLDGRLFKTERQLVLVGEEKKGKPVHITPYGGGVLIAGISGTGKSTFATALLESFAAREFQFCVLDPEGDYEDLEGAVMVGDADQPPNQRQILELLAKPATNVVVNMLGLKTEERPDFFAKLLPELMSFRARTGRPHWLLIDEAHHMMPAARDGESLTIPKSLAGTVMITVHPDLMSRAALEQAETVIGIGPKAEEMIASVCDVLDIEHPDKIKPVTKKKKALFWDRSGKGPVRRIDVVQPKQRLKRHRRKYAEGDLKDHSFYFRGPKGELNLKAQNLMVFVQLAEGIDERTWKHHLQAGDYSDWFRRCIRDDELADVAEAVEKEPKGDTDEGREKIIEAVRSRYTVPAD